MPLFWLCLAFGAGVALSPHLNLPDWVWLAGAAILMIVGLVEWRVFGKSAHPLLSRRLVRLPAGLLLAAFALGGWRYQSVQLQWTDQDIAFYTADEPVILDAIVISYPEDRSTLTAVVDAVSIEWEQEMRAVKGRVQVRLPSGFHLQYGDRVRLEGILESALRNGQAVHAQRLTREGVFSRMEFPEITTLAYGQGSLLMRAIYQLRSRAYEVIYQSMPFPDSALLGGILLGIDWDMPPLLNAGYRAAGIIHIIAISGFNIAIIASLVIRVFRRILPMYWDGLLAVIAITAYAVLAGAQPPVIRAVIMGSMSIPAYYIGRRQIGVHSLTLAAAIMLAANPLILWDISFQLSFLACLGLMIFADPLEKVLSNVISHRYGEVTASHAQPLLVLLTTTLSAQFIILPVLLTLDRSLPALSLLANLLVLPLQPLVMALGGFTVLGGLAWLPLGRLFGRLCWPLLAFSSQLAMRLGVHPLSVFTLPPQSSWIALGGVSLAVGWGMWNHLRAVIMPEQDHALDVQYPGTRSSGKNLSRG